MAGLTRRRLLSCAGAVSAAHALPWPALANSAPAPGAVNLTPAPGRASLVDPRTSTAVWGYNGAVPGPLLRMREGEPFSVRLYNGLPEPTTVHWHGLRIGNAMDGVGNLTQAPVEPGAVFDYRYTAPDPGTYWYHPHFRSATAVARGLYGALIVDETQPPRVDLDLPMLLDDWRLDDNDQLDTASFGNLHDAAHAGRLGNVLTVNGRPAPDFALRPGARLRLRLINAANARVMNIDFGGLQAIRIALDGQPTAPLALGPRTVLAPGQRLDVIVDIDPRGTAVHELTVVTRGGSALAARLLVEGSPLRAAPPAEPVALAPNRKLQLPDPAQAMPVQLLMQGGAMGRLRSARYQGRDTGMRELAAQGQAWALNGEAGMPREPLFSVARGRAVRLSMLNDTRWPHAMHLHGHHVRVLNAGPREVADSWRDTVLVDPMERIEVAFVADNPGRWMLHCHMLEHQVAGMATWFEVT